MSLPKTPYRPRTVLGAFLSLLPLVLLPLLVVRMPPLVDYPQHIARVFILVNFAHSRPLQTFYALNWGWQPNLAIDVIGSALALLMPLEIAGKLFLALMIGLLASGPVILHRALHHRWSPWPLLGYFLVFNRVLLGGIVNYLFSLGAAFWAVAAWIWLRHFGFWPRVLASSALALLLYFGHLTAFGCYAIIVIGYELSLLVIARERRWRVIAAALATLGLQFVAPALVFRLLSVTVHDNSALIFSGLFDKLSAPLNLVYNYSPALDGFTFLVLLALLGYGATTRRLRIAVPMVAPFVMLALIFLAMPDRVFGSLGADRRLTIPIAMLLIAATDWRLEGSRREKTAIGLLVALFVIRMAVITVEWHRAETVYQRYADAFRLMEPGARLAVVVAHKSWETTENPPVNYISSMAVPSNEAFVPCTFTNPGQQPIVFTPAFEAIARPMQGCVFFPPELAELRDPAHYDQLTPLRADRLAPYDYLLMIHEEDFPRPVPSQLAPVFTDPGFRLLRIPPP